MIKAEDIVTESNEEVECDSDGFVAVDVICTPPPPELVAAYHRVWAELIEIALAKYGF